MKAEAVTESKTRLSRVLTADERVRANAALLGFVTPAVHSV
jgi:2-phospho-L-lactate guanylyltransferase (CobY/MobA/RfbA family)